MPAHRTTMRRIKEVLRLKWTCNLSHRQVSGALGVGLGTITQYLQLAASAGQVSPVQNERETHAVVWLRLRSTPLRSVHSARLASVAV